MEVENILTVESEYNCLFVAFTEFLHAKCHIFQNSTLNKKAIKFILPFLSKGSKHLVLSVWDSERLHCLKFIQNQNKEICKIAKSIIKANSK